ncbi:MAG: thymidine phosphorylase [Vampirovibrionales bacterium]|nr:thymidine phosphorylase [Vampirovibrionales bacterium]
MTSAVTHSEPIVSKVTPAFNILSFLSEKRHSRHHTQAGIHAFVQGVMEGSVTDYQASAWLMAVCCNGLSLDETAWLTEAYVDSGERLDVSALMGNGLGPVVDKHSTGGVGDKTTLVLLPVLAACGAQVVKLSGRGLGFTGGTIDKLEAIPGFHTALDNAALISQTAQLGLALSSQTPNLAPADGTLYALRDVTSTVDSIPLIAASVVSKKIASGAPTIVLDIKVGLGAFMKTLEEARQLAEWCRAVGQRLGRSIATVISSMEEPLGYAIGHTLEVMETIDTLKGQGPKDLVALTVELGAVTLFSAGVETSLDAAKARIQAVLNNGDAYALFERWVSAQGGDVEAIRNTNQLPQAKNQLPLLAATSGTIAGVDALLVAQAAKMLGAGRTKKEDVLDLSVGVIVHKKVGECITAGEPWATLYANTQGVEEAQQLLSQALSISVGEVTLPSLILETCLPDSITPNMIFKALDESH